jgi:soluble lytic murein transglycosylase-like protein
MADNPPISVLLLAAGLALFVLASAAASRAEEGCAPAIKTSERENNLPSHLLRAIGAVESGRPDRLTGQVGAWPWTVNAGGDSRMFDTRDEAIAFVRDAQARGIRSIDVGCMQINLMYHPDAFASLEEAFTPEANVRYAATFLLDLHRRTGDWTSATGNYHSTTPGLSETYARRVRAVRNAEPSGAPLPALAVAPLRPVWTSGALVMIEASARPVRVIVPGTAPLDPGILRLPASLPRVYLP